MSILIQKTLSPLVLLFCCTVCFFVAQASAEDKGQQIVNAACDIQYASQKIAKSYFYKELDIRYESAVQHMQDGMAEFDKNIPILQQGIKSKEEENIMKFLLSSYEQLTKILPKPYSDENGSIVIDASESIFEAADFLSKEHLTKERNTEELMLSIIQRQLRLLERINKYYIAHHAGIENSNNVIQLKQSVSEFETGLQKITKHESHRGALEKSVKSINKLWPIAKDFYLGIQSRAQPVIVLAATDKLIDELATLEKHHKLEIQEAPQKH
ncbi:MAG: hypothetical protein SD837_07490 [Candidatus Electrothrix scaldis]|nr:MAG: hypothetical protein SD837_07490 [Candidatus Electrothrix sp. GW3-3]